MSKTFALILIFILGIEAQAQTACTNTMTCKVVAPSGMRMRSEASLKSKVVVNVPKDSVLSACTDKFAPMSYENINGYWRKVKYKGSEGYMFDGFLEVISINKSDKITYEDIKRRMDSLSALPDSLSQLQVVKTDGTAVETLDSLAKIDSTEIDSLLNKNPEVTSKKMDYTLLTEAYNYCGDVQKIDPGMVWYGIYPKDDETEFYRDVLLFKKNL